MSVRVDCHNHIGVELGSYLCGDFPYAQMLPSLVQEGQALGVTHWIVFPMVTNLALDIAALRERKIVTGGLEHIPYAFENRRMLEELHSQFPAYVPAIFPFAMFDPLREPQAQAQILRALRADFPLYGLKTQTTILQAPIKSLLDGGRVFLELAEEWDLAVLIHSSVYPGDPWAQAADILDIVEATPQVRFCVAHSCRFDKVSLDQIASLPNAWFDCSAHIIHCRLAAIDSPHVALREQRFDSDYSRPEQVLRDLAEAYPQKLMWGSDSPYYSFATQGGDFALFSSYAEEVACLKSLPNPVQEKIACDNTRRCFRLPLTGENR